MDETKERNKKDMENPFNSPKATRILYACAVSVLCVVAIIIGIVAAANRAEPAPVDPGTTNPPADNTPAPDKPTGGEESNPPVYLCPVSGTVNRRHDTETLVFSDTMGDWRIHTGTDIACSLGDTVEVTADGTVQEVWDDAMMGKCVSVSHQNGVVSIYKNLADVLAEGIEAGATVKAGDAIGQVGETALSELADAPHLHFEMTVDGKPTDPLSLLSKDSIETSIKQDDTAYED